MKRKRGSGGPPRKKRRIQIRKESKKITIRIENQVPIIKWMSQSDAISFIQKCINKKNYFYIGASTMVMDRPIKDVRMSKVIALRESIKYVIKMKTRNPKRLEGNLLKKFKNSSFCLNTHKKSGFSSSNGYVYVTSYSACVHILN